MEDSIGSCAFSLSEHNISEIVLVDKLQLSFMPENWCMCTEFFMNKILLILDLRPTICYCHCFVN